jgi:predicted short-subunit dehydrogenase-like oxidoreductase (DUF2520 family)
MRPPFAVVGAGRAGCGLARLLARQGYPFVGAASRSHDAAQRACNLVGGGHPTRDPADLLPEARLVFVTTPDDSLSDTAHRLAESATLRPDTVVAHCSGALTASVLAPLQRHGAAIGSFHPLTSFPVPDPAAPPPAVAWCAIDGDPAAVAILERVATDLGAQVLLVDPDRKILYHAAAVFACNFLVPLIDAAVRADAGAGIDTAHALASLRPLIETTLDNLARHGVRDALSGPIARGDADLVRRQIAALDAHDPQLATLYRELSRHTLAIARRRPGYSADRASELAALLESAP